MSYGYRRLDGSRFDRQRAIFCDEALAFTRATQAKGWEKLEALRTRQIWRATFLRVRGAP